MKLEDISLISIFFGIVSIVIKKYFELPFWVIIVTYIIILCTFFYIGYIGNNQIDYKNPNKVSIEPKDEPKDEPKEKIWKTKKNNLLKNEKIE